LKFIADQRHSALAALIIAKRKAAGITQQQVADSLGQYQSFVARLESGQRRIDVVEFLDLAQILNFDAAKALREIEKIGTK
jgi:transcriptional regulator with XRE-family HTH domain